MVLIIKQLPARQQHRSAGLHRWFWKTAVPFAAYIPVLSNAFYAVDYPAVLPLKLHPLPIQSHLFCAAAVPFLLPLAEQAVLAVPENH